MDTWNIYFLQKKFIKIILEKHYFHISSHKIGSTIPQFDHQHGQKLHFPRDLRQPNYRLSTLEGLEHRLEQVLSVQTCPYEVQLLKPIQVVGYMFIFISSSSSSSPKQDFKTFPSKPNPSDNSCSRFSVILNISLLYSSVTPLC